LRHFFNSHKSADIHDFMSHYFTYVHSEIVYEKPGHDIQIFRACPLHRQCSSTSCHCLAVKITKVLKNTFDVKAAIAHEHLTQRMKHTQGAPHFNLLLGFFLDSAPKSSKVVLATEYEIPYFPTCKTLSEVIKQRKLTALEWKAVNFQLVSALAFAQKRVPGFCHNDTHLQNILLVPNTTKHPCKAQSAKRVKFYVNCPFLVRFIDFDLVTYKGGGSLGGHYFFRYTPANSMIDFFRFASSCNHHFMQTYKSPNPPKHIQEWREFVIRYLPPVLIYEDSPSLIEKFIDPNGAILTEYGGSILQDLYGPKEPSVLLRMLDDPYFKEFRV
jgi:hypothetical protein